MKSRVQRMLRLFCLSAMYVAVVLWTVHPLIHSHQDEIQHECQVCRSVQYVAEIGGADLQTGRPLQIFQPLFEVPFVDSFLNFTSSGSSRAPPHA